MMVLPISPTASTIDDCSAICFKSCAQWRSAWAKVEEEAVFFTSVSGAAKRLLGISAEDERCQELAILCSSCSACKGDKLLLCRN